MATLDIEQLLDAPNLPQLIKQAELALRQEARRREDFYAWLKEDVKAEFINGQIVMHSPVKERHWTTVGNIYRLLSLYAIKKKIGRVASEKALIALIRNDYEPDVCFWKQEKAVLFTADQMKLPAPDLVIEVLSKGTAKRDRGVKFTDYAANGIAEYWIVNPGKKTVEQYELDPDLEEYASVGTFSQQEEIESKQVVGFRVSVLALFDEEANITAYEKLFF
ncbi:Uma2 family endonuclease [Spirosoma spitsbergense]|uniref:Uma2 family endonuclease n=1 Tax=Spirosoma spitsbergense TaxID=431554 RepID=UPI0003659012|nr:Uma2 family endonuclease [Spirosoma spitsbergense]